MTCTVVRPKKGSRPLWKLSPEKRAMRDELLRGRGIDVERLPKLIWPEGSVSASQDHLYAPWQFKFKSDILREKREEMERAIEWKRESGSVQRRALYVWVFWCPGISGFYEGWYTYLVGIGQEYGGGGHKGDVKGRLMDQVVDLFPVYDKPLFGWDWESREEWMLAFVRRHRRGTRSGKPQGKAPVWAEVRDGDVRNIISRAEWPRD